MKNTMSGTVTSLLDYLATLAFSRDNRARGLRSMRSLTRGQGAVPTRDALRNLIVRKKVPLDEPVDDVQEFVSQLMRGGEAELPSSHRIYPRAGLDAQSQRQLMRLAPGEREAALIQLLASLSNQE